MSNFTASYTTDEKITEDSKKPEKEQTEKGKTILSNDAYAVGELLEKFTNELKRGITLLVR